MRPALAVPFMSLALLLASSAAAQPAGAPPWSSEGRIEDGDPQDENGQRYDEHRLRLEAGRRYRISARSDDFDTVIRLFQAGEREPVAENDDYGDGLNSQLGYTPEETDDYVLRVLTYSEEGRGAYMADAEVQPPLPPPNREPAWGLTGTRWHIWQGELSAADPDRDGSHFDDYLVPMRRGETRLIMLESADFDPLLWVLRADGREGEPLHVDDDAGPGLNSLAVFQPEEDGDYVVRVTSYGSGDTGAYRVRISEPVTPPPLQAPVEEADHAHDE